jgi:inhibitor of cysteine peptidase
MESNTNSPSDLPTDSPLVLDNGDKGKTVDLKTGQILEVALPSNPTTGYTWEIIKIDPEMLEVDGKPLYDSPKTNRQGDGTIQRLRFRGVKAGATEVMLGYRRPWEKESKNLNNWNISVKIQK